MGKKLIWQKLLIINLPILLLLNACGHKPPTTEINVQAAHYLNPDINGRSSPLVVSIYQLKASYHFKQASYLQLAGNILGVLGNELIDKQTIEIRPRQRKKVIVDLADATQYIGVVADYRNIEAAQWRKVIKLPKDKNSKVSLALQSQAVALRLLK